MENLDNLDNIIGKCNNQREVNEEAKAKRGPFHTKVDILRELK